MNRQDEEEDYKAAGRTQGGHRQKTKQKRSTKRSTNRENEMESKTNVDAAETLNEVGSTRTPLAKVVPIEESRVDLFNPKKWTVADIDVIKKTVCPAGIPDADFKLFIMKCQASGMNPLLGEAFCIKRNQNIGTKEYPKWIEVFQFTPGEQGMEGRADDFPDYRGLRAAAVYENDKIVIDPSTGEVSHQYNPAGDRGRLLGAWAIAFRENRKTPVEYVQLAEYADPRNPKWAASPATMIVKCARAAALRRAYPNAFDGIYAREELRDDGAEESATQSQSDQANRSTADKLADRMKTTGAAQAAVSGTHGAPSSAKQQTVDVVATKPVDTKAAAVSKAVDVIERNITETQQPANTDTAKSDPTFGDVARAEAARRAAAEKVPEGPVMVFGGEALKGKPIAGLTGPQLLEMAALGRSKMGTLDGAKKAKVQACVDAIDAEQKRREKALVDDLDVDEDPPEPGSNG